MNDNLLRSNNIHTIINYTKNNYYILFNAYFKMKSNVVIHIIKHIYRLSFSYLGKSTWYLLKYFDVKFL